MKLIFAIIQADDADNVIDILTQSGFMVTKLASTGGFLRKGNATLMIGTSEDKVNPLIRIFRDECGKREQMMYSVPFSESPMMANNSMVPIEVGGATIFVLDVERFEKV